MLGCGNIIAVNTIILLCRRYFFFFKQKTASEMRISDWSSDVCSSDLLLANRRTAAHIARQLHAAPCRLHFRLAIKRVEQGVKLLIAAFAIEQCGQSFVCHAMHLENLNIPLTLNSGESSRNGDRRSPVLPISRAERSEEHTSELQ